MERYDCIQKHAGEHSIVDLCELLAVAKSGYYAWCQRAQGKQEAMNEELLKMITEIFAEHRGRYGSPRITKALRDSGRQCNHKRVERLMREQGLKARARQRWKPRTTDSRHPHPIAPNLLLNQPAPTGINQVWVQDITYLPTAEGWLYLAAVLDLYSRRLIGWSMQETLAARLPLAALQMAVEQRGRPQKVVHHSDRGVQYASTDYRQALQQHGLIASMSRKANCYDNATMESFWSTLKSDTGLDLLEPESHHEAELAVFDYIETFYNRTRRHSSLGGVSPVTFEQRNKQRTK